MRPPRVSLLNAGVYNGKLFNINCSGVGDERSLLPIIVYRLHTVHALPSIFRRA